MMYENISSKYLLRENDFAIAILWKHFMRAEDMKM
jgi:hypothetical protein